MKRNKADSAIQGVKVNGTTLTPDANKIVDILVGSGSISACDNILTEAGILPPTGYLKTYSETGPNVYVLGPFQHVFYRVGDNAVPLDDTDNSGVPDYVEDVASQYIVAYHIYADVIGIRAPFLSPRHVGKNYQYIMVSHTRVHGDISLAYSGVETDNKNLKTNINNLNVENTTGFRRSKTF